MAWSNWHDGHDVEVKVGGVKKAIQGTPAVVAWKKGLLHVFIRGAGTDANIYHGKYSGDTTAPAWTWEALKLPAVALTADIVASSWGDGRIDLYARGTDKKIYRCAWTGTKWDDAWNPIRADGSTDYAPAAASWSDKRLDVFVHTSDHRASNAYWDGGSSFKEWHNVGGYAIGGDVTKKLNSAITAAASGAKRIDLFAVETSSRKHLVHSFFDGTAYDSATAANQKLYEWANPDTSKTPGATNDETHEISGFPAACSSRLGDGRVDVFVRSGARLLHREFKGNHFYTKWEDLGGTDKHTIVGDPAAVSWWDGGWSRFDCFAVGANNVLKHISWP